MMMIPEAWQNHESMSDAKRAFYQFHSCMMEPWDGPASIAFTDGRQIGAVLDRNGLRPSRYTVTKDGLVVMASETGVLDIPPRKSRSRAACSPGACSWSIPCRAASWTTRKSRKGWRRASRIASGSRTTWSISDDLPELPAGQPLNGHEPADLLEQQQAFGYTLEELKMLLAPMALNGQEAVGSMGNDTPLAVLSNQHPLLFNYFKQLFAQVTNPPVDPIREETGDVGGDHDRRRAKSLRRERRCIAASCA